MENNINILEKNFEEHGCDWISELPDSLLLHILSFLHMEDVLRTSFLSRRWRYVWTSITTMDFNFGPSHERILRPIEYSTTFIDKSTSLHIGVRYFRVHFDSLELDHYPPQVSSWIHFAVDHNVEELDLAFAGEGNTFVEVEDYDERKLTPFMFNCRSLRTLSLTYVALDPPTSTSFSSLKTLYLARIILSANKIKNLTSNCPLLEDIIVKDCSSAQNLDIFVENRQLHCLTVMDSDLYHFYDDHDYDDLYIAFGNGFDDMGYMTTKIEIYAPNLLSLKLIGNKPRREYRIKNLQSLVEASIDYEEELYNGCHECYEHNINSLKGLLEDLRHVKDLKLCSWCIQIHNYRSQQRLNWEDKYDFDERVYWKSQKLCFYKLFEHLKTVIIYDLSSYPTPVNGYEPTPTDVKVKSVIDEPENEINFVKFLLSNSTVMEKMDISILEEVCSQPEFLLNLTERLLAFPRASPKAEIHVSY
ncbi:F-box/LRR-repeat protein At3g26922-like isoform X2 [Magnolia sinica]|uniref:F-box/LRR-repeat protein At3g26922-like isoform X2 n=1 Tax=Magnolia sinica TaxID=86752 RepID=UPI00265894E8|nr:F-box/LRR-repeat protein At3g26922-like isoform X2 [Magnolia sinica]